MIWTLRPKDADGNENIDKTIGLISQTTALHVHHTAVLYIFSPFLHYYDVKVPNFPFYSRTQTSNDEILFLSLEIQLQESCLHLTK